MQTDDKKEISQFFNNTEPTVSPVCLILSTMERGSGTVVNQLTYNPKLEGFNPPAAGTVE